MNQLIEDLKAAADELEPGLPVEHGCPCNYCTQAIRRNNLITRLRTHAAQLAASERAGAEAVAIVEDWPDDFQRIGIVPLVDLGTLPIGTKLYTHSQRVTVTEAQAREAFEKWYVAGPRDSWPTADGIWFAALRYAGALKP